MEVERLHMVQFESIVLGTQTSHRSHSCAQTVPLHETLSINSHIWALSSRQIWASSVVRFEFWLCKGWLIPHFFIFNKLKTYGEMEPQLHKWTFPRFGSLVLYVAFEGASAAERKSELILLLAGGDCSTHLGWDRARNQVELTSLTRHSLQVQILQREASWLVTLLS